jgi:hypothetical protein
MGRPLIRIGLALLAVSSMIVASRPSRRSGRPGSGPYNLASGSSRRPLLSMYEVDE